MKPRSHGYYGSTTAAAIRSAAMALARSLHWLCVELMDLALHRQQAAAHETSFLVMRRWWEKSTSNGSKVEAGALGWVGHYWLLGLRVSAEHGVCVILQDLAWE